MFNLSLERFALALNKNLIRIFKLENYRMPSEFLFGDFIIKISRGKCLKEPNSITVEAFKPEGLKDIVEILALKFPPSKANYSREWRCLTIKMFDRLIGLYASGKISFCADDIEDAKEILKHIKKLMDEAKKDLKMKGSPSMEEIDAWNKLTPLELYKYLPKTNCGECGEQTCMAFAVKVLTGEKGLGDCLALSQIEDQAEMLEKAFGRRVLEALGWKK